MKRVNHFILKVLRYNIDTVNVPKEANKCVLTFAPHTSISDFVIGRMALSAMGVKTVFLIKKEAFWFPLGLILRKLGGVPVDRQHVHKFPLFAANYIKSQEKIAFLIAPEGTRTVVTNWKKGFYYIAQQAEVPILLGYLDYGTRRGGIGEVFYPTGNIEKDITFIQEFYYGMRGLNKGQFNFEDKPLSDRFLKIVNANK